MTGPGCDEQKQSQANRKRSTAVPALVLADGTVLTDSWSIAAYSGLAPIGDEQRELYDKELGPLARQFAYGVFLNPANRPLWDRVLTKDQGWLWRLTYYFFGNSLWKILRTLFAVGDGKEEEECERKLLLLCRRIEKERLGGVIAKKHAYINGDAYTLEDVALCSLLGPATFPPQYCDGVFEEAIDELEAKGDGGFDKIKRFRETEIGRYVARFYLKHRR
jgi:glutathione S-transferase